MSLLKMMLLFRQVVGVGQKALDYITQTISPTFTDSVTVVPAGGALAGSVFPQDLNGKTQVLVSGNWNNGIEINTIKGLRGAPIIFKPAPGCTIGNSSLANHAFRFLSGAQASDYIEAYDFALQTANNASMSGLVWFGLTTGSTGRFFGFRIISCGYAGYLGQDNNSTRSYKRVLIMFWVVDGFVNDGEGIYQGFVTITSASACDWFILMHCRIINKGREGVQVKKVNFFCISNNTFKNIGQVSGPGFSGQDHCFQVEASNGYVQYNIFDVAHRPWNLFSHGYTVQFNVIIFNAAVSTSEVGYFGNALNAFPGDPRLNGQKVTVQNNIIVWAGSGPLPYITEIAENGCDIEFKNNVFVQLGGPISALYFDNRGVSPTNVITGQLTTNGNTLVNSIPAAIAYMSTDSSNANFLKLASNSKYFYDLGIGAFTKTATQFIIDRKEVVDVQVPFNTAWATAVNSLPSTVSFYLSDGSTRSMAVTWAQGSYVAGTPGTYQVYGTPTLPGDVTNPFTVKAEQYLTVNAAPTVKIRFAPNAASYIATGNWNNIFDVGGNFSGVQTIKGDNSGQTLASLRDTDGTLKGWGINFDLLCSSNNTGQDPAGTGPYPDQAQINLAYNPGGAASSRGFVVTGLNNAHSYKFDLLCTAASFLSGSQILDLNVGGQSRTGIDIKGNTTTKQSFTVTPSSGQVAVRIIKNTGQASISVLEITDLG